MFQEWFQFTSTLSSIQNFFSTFMGAAPKSTSPFTTINVGSISVVETIILAALLIFGYALYSIIKQFKEPKIEPPKAYSNNLNFNIWFNQVEQFLDEAKIITDKAKIDTVVNKLDTQSRSTIKELLKNRTITTYKHLQDHLQSFYNNDIQSRTEHLINFAERFQLPEENLHQYYTAVAALARKAYPNENDQNIAKFTSDQFISGLNNSYIKLQLLERKDSKINILSQALALQSKYGNAANDLASPLDTCHLRTQRAYSNSPNNRRSHQYTNQQPTFQQQPERFTNRSSSHNFRNERQAQNNNRQRHDTNNTSRRAEQQCFNCRQAGHYASQCPYPPTRATNNERDPNATRPEVLAQI